VRLTDPALVLVEHADALLERAALAETDLGRGGRHRHGPRAIAGFQSVLLRIALPAMQALARDAPRLRCELVEAEPEQSLPALALGDVDLVLGDEWQHQPLAAAAGLERHELLQDPVRSSCPRAIRRPRHHARAVPMAELAGEAWTSGHAGWLGGHHAAHVPRYGGFEPDIRHRTNDATVSLVLVARGLAVALLPDLVVPGRHPGRGGARHRRGLREPRDLRRHAGLRRGAPLDARARRRDRGAVAELPQTA
jgi:DNA-binding transcriptional LysR family regulator